MLAKIYICDLLHFFTEKNIGSSPGFTGKFTGIYREVSWDMGFFSRESASELTGIYPDMAMSSPGKYLYLSSLGTSHFCYYVYCQHIQEVLFLVSHSLLIFIVIIDMTIRHTTSGQRYYDVVLTF